MPGDCRFPDRLDVRHFSDTDFVFGRALSQTVGTAVIRLTDAGLLPYHFGNFSETVRNYINELKRLDADQRAQIEEQNRELDEGDFAAAADPRKMSIPPPKSPVPPHLNFAPVENGIDALARSARTTRPCAKANPSNIQAVSAKLMESEQRLTDAADHPGRPWFRHMIYAPGFYTGYGVKTIPGVREAIEQKLWQEAVGQIQRGGAILTKEASLLDEATSALSKSRARE